MSLLDLMYLFLMTLFLIKIIILFESHMGGEE